MAILSLGVMRFLDAKYAEADGAPVPGVLAPQTATVSGGTFSTYVQTGREGRNRFRVYDPEADVASAPVIITVG